MTTHLLICSQQYDYRADDTSALQTEEVMDIILKPCSQHSDQELKSYSISNQFPITSPHIKNNTLISYAESTPLAYKEPIQPATGQTNII